MADKLFVELTAPNGVKFDQPIGLFINNEWVAAKSGEKIQSVNPAYVRETAFWCFDFKAI